MSAASASSRVMDRHRDAARDDRLELAARQRAAAQVVEELLERKAHRRLRSCRAAAMWPQTEIELGAGALRVAEAEHSCTTSAPLMRMCGTAASVSTLLIVVGMPNTPATAGNGGLMRGLPRLPSSEFISAVSSPQMYAPAPRCTHDVDPSCPLPIAFVPRVPAAYASVDAPPP